MTDLNNLRRPTGANRESKRLGRGPGSGTGTRAGRGDKGQKARSGARIPAWFEGGQMPLQRRLPKVGFNSRGQRWQAEVRLHELAAVEGDVADLDSLKAADVLSRHITRAKVIASGTLGRAVTVRGLGVTRGARAAIEAAGGKIED